MWPYTVLVTHFTVLARHLKVVRMFHTFRRLFFLGAFHIILNRHCSLLEGKYNIFINLSSILIKWGWIDINAIIQNVKLNWWRDRTLTPNLLLVSGRVTCAPQMWAVWSPDEVKASSLSGWNLIELTEPWCPWYCSTHCLVCIDQTLAEWSYRKINSFSKPTNVILRCN